MSGVAGAFAEKKRSVGGTPCSVCEVLRILEDDDRAALQEYLSDTSPERLSHRDIAEVMTNLGKPLHRSSVERHRRLHRV